MDISRIVLPTTGIRLNDTEYVNYMEHLKTLDICKYDPPSWLQHTETPFKWAQVLNPKNMMKYDIDRKLSDYPEEDPDGCYSFEKVCLYILRIFQYAIIEDHNEVRQSLQTLKDFVEMISKNEDDYIYNRIGESIKHVLLAVTAQVSLSIGDITEEDSQNIALNLFPYSEMEPKVQAGIEAIKANFYISWPNYCTLALKHMMEATTLDPKYAVWLYWTGKFTRKIRRNKIDGGPQEEIRYFESALELRRDPKYILFLAQGYREKAQDLFYQHNRKCTEDGNILFHKSHQLYKECWDLKKDSAAINRRLGTGVLRLKQPDYNIAEDSLTRAYNISNNPIIFHILGSFYSKHKKDCQIAVKYFTEGAEHGLMLCFNELIRMKYILDPKYDPYKDLMIVEEVLKYSFDLPMLYSDIIWYYLSIRPDLNKAVEYVFKVLEKKGHDYLQRFLSYTFLVNDYVNLYPILKYEVFEFQVKNEGKGVDNLILKKFLDEITENHHLVPEDNRDSSLSSVTEASMKVLQFWRKQFKVNDCGKSDTFADHSSGSYRNRKKAYWGNEEKEVKSSKNRSSNSYQNLKYCPDKLNYNWRT